jgi:hypothetical protein
MTTDDTLLLYHLNDGLDASERAAIDSLLQSDEQLRGRLARIAAEWDALDELAVTPALVPDDTQRRWHAALERAAEAARQPAAASAMPNTASRGSVLRWWAMLGAVAAGSLALVFALHTLMPMLKAPVWPAIDATPVAADNPRFERSVRLYLGEARRQVETLSELPPTEREEVVNLVLTHNRLYIAAAERAASPAVARSLRALNPVLESLDTNGSDPTALEGGIAQIDFEMKVIQARLAQRAPAHERLQNRPMAL